MSRARSSIRPEEIKVSIPMDLSARIDTLLWDPVLHKPRYGARSELITQLLSAWCNEQETSPENEIQGEPEISQFAREEGSKI